MKYLVTILSVCITSSAYAAEPWASFQNGGNVSRQSSADLQLGDIQWEIGLQGYGQSSPVVWDELIYITTVEGENKEQCSITAYQLNDGKQAWQYTVTNPSPQTNSTYVSRAAPTPVADAEGLICFFEGGNVVALSHDGSLRWERNLVEDYGDLKARHDLSSSIEQDNDSAFVWVEQSADPYIVSLSKKTGRTKWKSVGMETTSWASPRLVPVAGGQHLVLSAIGSLAGLDPDSGEQLWRFDGISSNSIPTPMPLGEGRFLIGATVARGESGGSRAAASNGMIQISKANDGIWSADYQWQAKRATSSFGSPIVHNEVAFFVNREGVLYGLNANDGEELFAKRLKGSVWATPLAAGKQVFFFGRDGKVNTLSNVESEKKITTWEKLPQPLMPDKREREAAGRGVSSGTVLYAAAWCHEGVLLRRGSRLFAVAVNHEKADENPAAATVESNGGD